MAASGSRRARGLVGIAVVPVLAAVATVRVDMALGGSSTRRTRPRQPRRQPTCPARRASSPRCSNSSRCADARWKLSARVEHAIPIGEAVGSAGGGGREIALSFDDGPSVYTSKVLDLLDRSPLKATFFVVGRNAALNPHLMRRAVRWGHHIGNHTCSWRAALAR